MNKSSFGGQLRPCVRSKLMPTETEICDRSFRMAERRKWSALLDDFRTFRGDFRISA